MTPGTRPGGLTAFAIINFIIASMSFVNGLFALAAPTLIDVFPTKGLPAEKLEQMNQIKDVMSRPIVQIVVSMGIPVSALLVISGIGYLKQKRIMGRLIGNVYALLAVTVTVVGFLVIDIDVGIPFAQELMMIIDLVYPVLTLILLNTSFRDDFPN